MSQRRVGKSSALLPRSKDAWVFAWSCHQGGTVLAFTWSFLQQLLQGSFTPEPGEKKEMFTFSLLFLIVSELVVCVELIFSVCIAAAYKDHSFHLLVPSTDGKSVRIRVGSFLCWALPASGNAQGRIFLSQRLSLEHHISQLSLTLFQFIQSPFEIVCTLSFHNIFTWRSPQYPHMLLGVTCYLVILLSVYYIIWSVLWGTVTKQNKHSVL